MSEQRPAEEALRQSERRFSQAFHANPAAIAISLLEDGRIIDMNESLLKILGFERHEVLGRTSVELGIWENSEDRARLVRALKKRGSLRHREARIRTKSGAFCDVVFSIEPIDLDGRDCLLSMFYEITDRKRVEELLRQSEERFKAQYKGVPVPTFTWQKAGEDFVFTDFNDAARALTRGTVAQMLGMTTLDVFGDRPEMRADLYRCHSEQTTLKRRGQFQLRATGEVKDFMYSYIFVPPDLVMIHAEDITEQKQAEESLRSSAEQYRLLFEHNPQPMWAVDRETLKYLAANEAAVQHYGYSREEFATMTLADLRPPEDVPALLDYLRRTRDQDPGIEIHHAGVWRHRKKDGTIIDVEISRSAITFRDRDAYLVLANDVTDRKALSARLESIREEEKASLAREIHDEFGQTLTALKMGLSNVSRNLARIQDPNVSPLLERMESMSRILDSTVSRVRQIALDLRPDILDNLGLVPAIEWYGQEFEARSGITCLLRIQQPQRLIDRVYATALFRILQEALTNVARHAQATAVEIRLEQEGRKLLLEVGDNGRGISEREIRDKRSLGLLGMRERSLLLNGEFEIEGVPGNGTTVRVTIHLNSSQGH